MRPLSARCTATPLLAFALFAAACGRTGGTGRQPTFTQDVAPIVFEHCASCHRPGQGTAVPLLTYDDVRPRIEQIGRAVSTGHMPPWPPETTAFPFAGERRLNSTQADTIWRWVDSGGAEGPASALPPAPSFPGGWQMGAPDLVVTALRPYTLAAGTSDVFRNLVMTTNLPSARYVQAVEFDAGGAPVHHAVVHIDRTASSRRLDGADGQPGFDGMERKDVEEPDGHFLVWVPGRGPIETPAGMSWRLDPGADLVVELHLVPGTSPLTVAPRVALRFSDQAPTAVPVMLEMGSKAIDIPAGEPNYVVTDTFIAPADVELFSLYPHAHHLGRDVRLDAEFPDGRTAVLLHIPRWNFRWQQNYRFVTPVTVPRGTALRLRFTYDNSAANERNPNRPPRQVLSGPLPTDEMGSLRLQLLPRSASDRQLLLSSARTREIKANLEGARMLVRNNPSSPEHQTFLAASLVDAGEPAEALTHLDLAIRLDPKSANAYNELGGAYLALGRARDALGAFERASRLAPNDERLLFNVAGLQAGVNRRADAEATYRRAIAINPGYTDAIGELGVLVLGNGRTAEAITLLRRALDLAPDVARLHNDLGGALAQAGRYAEARVHVQRALEIDPVYQPAIENLRKLGGR